MVFKPGDVCQFDWSQEIVEIGCIEQIIKTADFHLAFSRKMFVIAYPREAREMVMNAHNKAFTFYGGRSPLQIVYDNPETIVDTVFVKFNRTAKY